MGSFFGKYGSFALKLKKVRNDADAANDFYTKETSDMETCALTIRAVYAAFARAAGAICPPALNLKGGGGEEMTARAISRVCAGVFAVVFASLFAAEDAKAQTRTCAQFDVFRAVAGSWTPTPGAPEHIGSISLIAGNSRLSDIIVQFPAGVRFGAADDFFRINLLDGRTLNALSSVNLDNIPHIGGAPGRDPLAGEVFIFNDNNGSPPANSPRYRIYNRAPFSNSALGFHLTQENPEFGKKCESELAHDEFFLSSSWRYTTTAVSTHMGYVAPNCAAHNMIDSGDNINCRRPRDAAECRTLNSEYEFNPTSRACGVGVLPTEASCLAMDNPPQSRILNAARHRCDSCGAKRTSDGRTCDIETLTSCREMNPPHTHILDENEMCMRCPDGEATTDGRTCVDESVAFAPLGIPSAAAESAEDDDDNNDLLIGLGGVAAVGIAAYFLSGGDFGLFAATPDFGYSLTESGYAVNAGGRVDFRKNRWHLYWTAGHGNVDGDFGDFRYSSGGEYKADFWTAAFSENVQGEIVDYDVSLSANYGEGVWQISPVYRLHSRFEEEEDGGLESETTNSLNLEGILRYHRWTIRPTAGFQWRNADDFADNAKFGISAVRNL